MRPALFSPIARLGVRPDPEAAEPGAFVAPRPRGSRRPHTDAKVATVRRLIEQTTLTYGEIAARTGVGRASICRGTRDGAWKRPPFAPRATDTVPRARASAKLRRRTLAARITALAERAVAELEASANVDLDKLAEALELLKMAKVAAQGRRRHCERRRAAGDLPEPPFTPTRPILQLCRADVDLHRLPRAALDDFLENRAPPPEEPAPRRGGRRGRRKWIGNDFHHAWMLEPEG